MLVVRTCKNHNSVVIRDQMLREYFEREKLAEEARLLAKNG